MPKFVPRQRKHKVLARENKPGSSQDTNLAEIDSISKAERDEKKRILREELRAQQPKISGKKQKRLDKYIVRFTCKFPGLLVTDFTLLLTGK